MADRATAERIRTLDHAVRAAVHGGADPVPDLARAAERRGGGGASRVRISSEATTSTARVVRAGPRTARLVAPMSRPIRAETPAPPAAAAPTCQAMTCWARRSPMRPGVWVIRAGKTPARAPPRTA